jgi:hypothetical protein
VVANHDLAGFSSIGIGAEYAISELLRFDAEPEDDADVALYQAFAIKAHSEIIQGVGYNSDAWIMVPGTTEKVPAKILGQVEQVWRHHVGLPFKPRKGWVKPEPPLRNWEAQLRKYIKSLVSATGDY